MARQTYYLHRAVAHPLYRTRMLQAGPLELDASAARLYRKLGVDLSDEAPKRAAKPEAVAAEEGPYTIPPGTTVPNMAAAAPKPAAKKAAPRKARAKKSK